MDHSSFSWERFERTSSGSRAPQRGQRGSDHEQRDDLFVFGYSCKLYRDSEKFDWINSGRQLIPWMGQEQLLIDRYDARGYLNDLNEYDSKFVNKTSTTLSNEEIELERLLNEERYADLTAESDETGPESTTSVAAQGQYAQVGYQYDHVENEAPSNDHIEDAFKAPVGLNISANLILPKSNKLHCIIEKTALFVAQQGSQMEILLKTKQASNSNFNFLSIDSELNPYYKFLLREIKSGRYVSKEGDQQNENESDDDSNDDNYLHPSLLSAKSDPNKSKLNFTNVFMSKQEDDSYSQLVKNFRHKFADDIVDEKSPDSNFNDNAPTSNEKTVSSLIPQPPSDVEAIICKLAQHVAKNGEDFENSIKALSDKKFDFLNPGHTYHAFYVKQKILYISEAKSKKQTKESVHNSSKSKSTKAIAFSIATKEQPKKMSSSALVERDLGENTPSFCESSVFNEASSLSKEKQLQIERKKKALQFLKMLRKENRIEVPQVTEYGPSLPKPKHDIQLSPTIEAITSPSHSPTFADFELTTSDKKVKERRPLNGGSLLPFTSKDHLIKDRSLSTSPKRKHLSHSPPRRYKLDKDEDSLDKKISTNRKRESKSSRKHSSRHRSRSRSRSPSKDRYRISKSRDWRHQSSRHDRHSTSSRSSISRSPSPRAHHSAKHRVSRQNSRVHRHQSRTRSRS